MKRYLNWKRFAGLFLAFALMATGCGAGSKGSSADGQSASETDTRETSAAAAQEDSSAAGQGNLPADATNGLPAVGDQMHGFTVAAIHPYESMNSQVVEFTHDKTGATLLWVANDSVDRSFIVAFRTYTTDDKGVPHVFEHATLSGSEKYPNPGQTMAAMYGTYNTYINAATYNTFTCYPSSSLSEEQLLKFVDFYMDGVYHPLVVNDERLMQREAYRYDLPSADEEITLQGTVYSEMLGMLTQEVSAEDEALRLTFPGSVVGNEPGGVPGVIETMTIEDLADFHDTYYHPSNSLMVLYGDLDVEPFLELIDEEYLSEFDRKEIDLSDSGYTPISGYVEKSVTFPASENDAVETYMFYTIPLTGMDAVEFNQLSFAAKTMMENGQPFDKLVKQRLPGVSVSQSLYILGPSPSLMFEVLGAGADQKDEVRSVIQEGIKATVEQGLDPELLAASVLSQRMDQAMLADNTTAEGAAENIVVYWGIKGDPLEFLNEDTFNQNLQKYLDEGVYDSILKKYLLDPDASTLLVSTSEPGLKEKQSEELAQKLADMKAAMSEEEIAELVAQHDELERWSAENEATLSVAPLQAVDVASLPEEVVEYTAKEEDLDGLRVVSSEVDSDLTQIEIYLDASGIPADQLDDSAVAMALLGMLSTENYDATAIGSKTASTVGGIRTYLTTIRQEDWSYAPCARISFRCFPEDLEEAFGLVEEQLLRTKFDPAEIRDLCSSMAAEKENNLDPYNYALFLAYAAFSEPFAYDSYANYKGLIQEMKRVSEMSDEELAQFAEGMKEMTALLCSKNGMILTVAGSKDNISAVTEQAQNLRGLFSDTQPEAADYSKILSQPRNFAATYGSNAMYNAVSVPFKELGIEYSGKIDAFVSVVRSKVLTPVMRDTYSVYTPIFSVNRDMATLVAYRDPRLRETFTEVLPSLSDSIRDLNITQEELDGYITNAYSDLAYPMGPFTGAATAIDDILTNKNSFERSLTEMKELKQMTPEDIAVYADIFDKFVSDGARVSVGNPQLIAKAEDLFDEVDTWLTD